MCPPLLATTFSRRPRKELQAKTTCAGLILDQFLVMLVLRAAKLLWGFEETFLSNSP